MLVKYMLRLCLGLVFVASLLGCSLTYAQSPLDPPATTTEPTVTEVPTETTDQKPQEETENSRTKAMPPVDVTDQGFPVDDRAVNIAEKANAWSMWQTIINAVGILLVALATFFAWGAWQAAKNGTKVGKNTLDATVEANKRGQRAYVGIKALNYHFLPMKDGRVSFAISCSIVNVGTTPAYNQKNSTQIRVVDVSETGNINTADLSSKGITLFPQTSPQLTVDLIISASDANALRSGDKVIFARFHITYTDIFGDDHWSKTQYTLRIDGRGKGFTVENGGALMHYSEENSDGGEST